MRLTSTICLPILCHTSYYCFRFPLQEVAALQRLYIGCLVKRGLFSRQLAALREIDAMLNRLQQLQQPLAAELLQVRLRCLCRVSSSSAWLLWLWS